MDGGGGADEATTVEARRLKSLAEEKYKSGKLKPALKYAERAHGLAPELGGVAEMVTAFKIIRFGGKVDKGTNSPHWYKILQVEPFSQLNTIKKQYKKLALTLHPDKTSFSASEEAFKLVGEAFQVLSDRIRRKEYDMKLRIAIQSAATAESGTGDAAVETFWTACTTCRLLHQFERKYLGHNLMCPSCRKTFKAVEVEDASEDFDGKEKTSDDFGEKEKASEGDGKETTSEDFDEKEKSGVRASARIHMRKELKRKMGSVEEILGRCSGLKSTKRPTVRITIPRSGEDMLERSNLIPVDELRGANNKEDSAVIEKPEGKKENAGEEMTLAEMQMRAKRKASTPSKSKNIHELKLNENGSVTVRSKKVEHATRGTEKSKEVGSAAAETGKRNQEQNGSGSRISRSKKVEVATREIGNMSKKSVVSGREKGKKDLDIMPVEDSDFYDFDEGRVERSFKRGQVWAVYDDDDGMPRHYALIDEVVSTRPFVVQLSWLDLQSNGNDRLINWEKLGFHISCGRFKVSRKATVRSVNIFSHIIDCEKAARDVYWIYPKKGSVWALYNENALGLNGVKSLVIDKRCYDIVVFLTSYTEMHGLSMAYLEKVDGFKTVFKRKGIGCHAIKWLQKDEIRLFSHQIPARKLSGDEFSDLSRHCWELDPASLPPELLTVGGNK